METEVVENENRTISPQETNDLGIIDNGGLNL